MRVSNLPDLSLLDNPIWHALATDQSYLAHRNSLAKRFPGNVAPFGAIRDQSGAAYQALAEILSGDVAALFLDAPPAVPEGWSTLIRGDMYQMVFDAEPPAKPNQQIRELTEADVPEMLALTKLTEPGPFLPRTIELGSYFGIHDSGSLVAMAGERLRPTGFTEVSAVCTHPGFRGRGYGNALTCVVISGILDRGETPFLHVKTENPAVGLYQKLGFKIRAGLHLAVLKHALPPAHDDFVTAAATGRNRSRSRA